MNPMDMAVIPLTNRIPGIVMSSVVAKLDSPESALRAAEELAQRCDYPVYHSSGKNVDVLAAAPLQAQAPRSMLIPLIIAGLIIFNTMMNSIAERKKEIYVYTSLGLAPSHVGTIFLAEALTYGMLGAVFGYIVGQGAATFLGRLGWMGATTLNYSGTQVIITIALVLGVVVISALVPAAMAARLASPSKTAGWRLPEAKNDIIRDLLPFTVTREASGGVLAFLHEFFDAHREGAIGHFACDHIQFIAPGGGHMGGVKATVWLEPYDLGVRQEVTVTVAPAADDICDLRLELRREAGQDRNWFKLNRTFVSGLRGQLLGWRKVGVERVLGYMAAAQGKLASAAAEPAGDR
jgi:hypothetical protein